MNKGLLGRVRGSAAGEVSRALKPAVSSFATLTLALGLACIFVTLPAFPGAIPAHNDLPEANAAISGNCGSTSGANCDIIGEIGTKGEDGENGGNGGRGGDGGWAYGNCAWEIHSGSTNGLKGLNGQKIGDANGGGGAFGGKSAKEGTAFNNCGDGGNGGQGGNSGQGGSTGGDGHGTYYGAGGGGGGGGGANAPARAVRPDHPLLSYAFDDASLSTLNIASGDGNVGGKGGNAGKGGLGGDSGEFVETREDSGSDDGFSRCNEANMWDREYSIAVVLGVITTFCMFPQISDTNPARTGAETTFAPNKLNWGHFLTFGVWEQCTKILESGLSLTPCKPPATNNNRYNVNRTWDSGRLAGAGTGAGGGGGGGGAGGAGGQAGRGQSVSVTSEPSKTVQATEVNIKSGINGLSTAGEGLGNKSTPGAGGRGGVGGNSGNLINIAGRGTSGEPGMDGSPGQPGQPSMSGDVFVDFKGTLKTCLLKVTKQSTSVKVHVGKLTAKDDCESLTISTENIATNSDFIIDEVVGNKPLYILNSSGKLRINKLTFDLNSYVSLPYASDSANVQIGTYNILDMSVQMTFPVKYNATTDNRIGSDDANYVTLSIPRQSIISPGKKVTLTDKETGYVWTYTMTGAEVAATSGLDFNYNILLRNFLPANADTPPFPSESPYLAYDTRYQVGVDQIFRVLSNDVIYQRYSRASPNIGEFRTKKPPTGSIIVSPKQSTNNASAVDVGINACQVFSAKVNVAPGLDKSVDWEIYGAESANTKFVSTSATDNGTNTATAQLCVDNDEASQTLFIKANLHVDEAVYDFAVVAVLGAVPTTVTIIDPSSKKRDSANPNASDAWQVQVKITLRDGIVSAPYTANKFLSWSMLSDVANPGITITNTGVCSHEADSTAYICPVTFNYVKPATAPSSVVLKVASTYDGSKTDAFQYILQSSTAPPGNFSITPDGANVDLSQLLMENYALLNFKAVNGTPPATCTKLVWNVVGNSSDDTKFQANDGADASSVFGGEVTLQVAKNETSAALTVKAICSGGATDGKFAVTTVNVKAPSSSLQIRPKAINVDLQNYISGVGLCTSSPATTCSKVSGGNDDGNIDVEMLQQSTFKPGVQTGVEWQVLGAKSPGTHFTKELTGDEAGNTQESGHLIIGSDETSTALFVVAKLKVDGGKVDYAAVKVLNQLQPNIGLKEGTGPVTVNTRSNISVNMSSGFTVPGVETQCTLGQADGVTYKKVPYQVAIQFPYGTKTTDQIVRASLMGGGYNTYANQPPNPSVDASISGYTHAFTGVVCISEFESATTLLLELQLSSFQNATAYVTINLEAKTSNSIRIDCISTPDCNVNFQEPATLNRDFLAQLSLPKTGADYFTEWNVLGGVEGTTLSKTSDDTGVISTATLQVSPDETASFLYVTAKSRASGVTDLYTVQLTNSKALGVRIMGANNSAPPNQAMPNSQIRVYAKVNAGFSQSKSITWSLVGNISDTDIVANGFESGTNNPAAMVRVGANENADTIWVVARLDSDPKILDIAAINIFGDRTNPQLAITPLDQTVDLNAVDFRSCSSAPDHPDCNKQVDFTATFNLPDRFYCKDDTQDCKDSNKAINEVEWSLIGGVETTPIYGGVQVPTSRIISTGYDERNMPTVKVGISPAETANILWLVAKSKSFEGLIAIGKIIVTGKWNTGVLIEPGNTCINIGGSGSVDDGCFHDADNSIDFNALTAVPLGAVDTVSWEIIGGSQLLEYGDPDCGTLKVTCITPEGKLYVSPSESSNLLYVVAKADYNPLLYDRVRVDIYGQHNQGVWMSPESWYEDTSLDKSIEYDSVWNVCLDDLSYDCVGTGTKEDPAPDSRCFKAAASGLPCRYASDFTELFVPPEGESTEDIETSIESFIHMRVNVNVIVPDGELNHDLSWEVYGATQSTHIAPYSFAEENVSNADGSYRRQAVLTLNPDETSGVVTVVARALYDPTRFDTLTIHIYGRNSAGVQISPRLTSASVGSRVPFESKVDVPNGESGDVIYSLVGANDTTHITDEGVLVISPFETSGSLTVVSTLVYDPNIFDYATVIVTGRKTSGVLISPQKPVFDIGSTNTLHARVTMPAHLKRNSRPGTLSANDGDNIVTPDDKYPECVYENVINGSAKTHCYNNDVTWKVLGGVSDTTINPRTGELKVSPLEVNPTLVVVAIADDDRSMKDAVIVEVSGRDGSAVRIDQRGDEVSVGTPIPLTAKVSVPEGHSRDLVWSIFGNSSRSTQIDASGVLSVAADEKSTNIAVMAQLKDDLSQFDVSHILPIEHIITTIQVLPHELTATRKKTSEFLAETQIPENRDQGVTWEISGNVSQNTSIVDGKLNVADDEKSSTISVKACLKDFSHICDHSIAFIDSSDRLGYLKESEAYTKDALTQIQSSVFSTSVWPVYQKNSNHVISFSTAGDARAVDSISVDGQKIDSVQYSFGGGTNFAVNYERGEDGKPVISALDKMFAVSIAYASAIPEDINNYNTTIDADSQGETSSTSAKVSHNVKGGVRNSSKTDAKVVIFNPEFLETLANGEHSVEVKYKNSVEQRGFRIVGSDDPIKTSSFSVAYLLLVVLLFLGLSVYLVRTRLIATSHAKLDDMRDNAKRHPVSSCDEGEAIL